MTAGDTTRAEPVAADQRLEALAESFSEVEFGRPFGQEVARVPRETYLRFVEAVRHSGFQMFLDLCAVDYLNRDPRFEVVVNLLSLRPPQRLRILVGIPGDDPTVPSLTGLFPGANFFERESFDLFGIQFEGHPDLTRILLPDDWEGYPLRKDVPVGAVPVQFKEANRIT